MNPIFWEPLPSLNHPVFQLLSSLGTVVLVGSRDRNNRPTDCPAPTAETDWDYYLGVTDAPVAADALVAAGAEMLPRAGGPYGVDGLIYGIARFPEATLKWAHCDVIIMSPTELELRVRTWQRLRQTRLPKALKAEVAWGQFWWATR